MCVLFVASIQNVIGLDVMTNDPPLAGSMEKLRSGLFVLPKITKSTALPLVKGLRGKGTIASVWGKTSIGLESCPLIAYQRLGVEVSGWAMLKIGIPLIGYQQGGATYNSWIAGEYVREGLAHPPHTVPIRFPDSVGIRGVVCKSAKNGGPCRGRTYGPLIKSPGNNPPQDTQQDQSAAKDDDL